MRKTQKLHVKKYIKDDFHWGEFKKKNIYLEICDGMLEAKDIFTHPELTSILFF